MQILRPFLSLAIATFVSSAAAQVEFRLAYLKEMPSAVPAVFPNDQLFKFMSTKPLIGMNDLRKATASLQQGRGVVAMEITESARKKFNTLVASNLKAQERGSFEDHVGLAVVVDGQIRQVIQGMFHELPSRTMWWSPTDDRLPAREQLIEAETFAKRINERRP